MAAKKAAGKKKTGIELADDEVQVEVVLPWAAGERPKRPVIPVADKRLVFKAQLGGDEYAACLTYMADKTARSDFLLTAIVDESKADLVELLENTEEGIGGVAATRITVSLARHYGMLGPGGDAPDPTKSGQQQ